MRSCKRCCVASSVNNKKQVVRNFTDQLVSVVGAFRFLITKSFLQVCRASRCQNGSQLPPAVQHTFTR